MIEVRGLHYRYPDGTGALQGIDLTIPDGAFLLLCGANGSGKTTLTRLLAGLLKPQRGRVLLGGDPIDRVPREIRTSVGLVFQDPDTQIVGETVWEDVAFGPENLGLSLEEVATRVDETLRAMGLSGLSEKSCHALSGGEKRRVALAGVLAMHPKTLIFDEPFTHLDYPASMELVRTLRRLHQSAHTLVVTTHDVEKVAALATGVAVLHRGRIVAQGRPDELVGELARYGVRPPCSFLLGHGILPWLAD